MMRDMTSPSRTSSICSCVPDNRLETTQHACSIRAAFPDNINARRCGTTPLFSNVWVWLSDPVAMFPTTMRAETRTGWDGCERSSTTRMHTPVSRMLSIRLLGPSLMLVAIWQVYSSTSSSSENMRDMATSQNGCMVSYLTNGLPANRCDSALVAARIKGVSDGLPLMMSMMDGTTSAFSTASRCGLELCPIHPSTRSAASCMPVLLPEPIGNMSFRCGMAPHVTASVT
mmetsp:Transcript_2208/g.5659  ORF Transcript_2208/g.5659 Transcript_2208/m.5659 type:complete len:229 (+) Transcript_2208:479-1165(+)